MVRVVARQQLVELWEQHAAVVAVHDDDKAAILFHVLDGVVETTALLQVVREGVALRVRIGLDGFEQEQDEAGQDEEELV